MHRPGFCILAFFFPFLAADSVAFVDLHVDLKPIHFLEGNGSIGPLTIHDTIAGGPLTAVETTTSLTIVQNTTNASLAVKCIDPLPQGVRIKVAVTPPSGYQNYGWITTAATDQTILSGLGPGTYENLPVTIRLEADVAAGAVTLTANSLEWTLA